MKTYNREHFLSAIDQALSIFFKSLLPLILVMISQFSQSFFSLKNILIKASVFIGLIILSFIFSIIKWFNKKYSIDSKKVILDEGVFISKHREIPFNKIQTINISQTIKQRLFSLASIKIDTGNSSTTGSEISIIMEKSKAQLFKDRISKLEKDDNTLNKTNKLSYKSENELRISNKELITTALTKGAWFSGIAIIFATYRLLDDYFNNIIVDIINNIAKYVEGIYSNTMSLQKAIFFIVSILFLYLIFSFVVAILKTFIKFYGFILKREGKNIIISYGLFEKRNYSITVSKISAIYIKQNLLRQLTGFGEMKIESVGYGDEAGENSILFPIANLKKQQFIIKKFLPEFYFEDTIIKVPTRSLKRFILRNLLFSAIPTIILTINFNYGYLSLLLIPIFILKGFKEYKNSGIAKNKTLIYISSKGFKKQISIIPIKRIQSIKISQNYFQKRAQLFNYMVSIQGNNLGTNIKVRNLSGELMDTFRYGIF